MELWTMRVPETGTVVAQAEARRGARAGTASRSPTRRTCAATRSSRSRWRPARPTSCSSRPASPTPTPAIPAALATVAATVQEACGGRFVLGIGRGDTALFHLGLKPMPVARVRRARHRSADVPRRRDARLRRPPEPHAVARPRPPAQGAARHRRVRARACSSSPAALAERVTLAVGADPDRVAWALDLPRKAAADAGRDPARSRSARTSTSAAIPTSTSPAALISGGVAAFAHFSSMPGSTGAGLAEADRAVVAEVGRRYDSNVHLRNTRRAHRGARSRLRRPLRDRRAARRVCADRLRELPTLGHRPLRDHRRELRRRPRRTPAPPTSCSPPSCCPNCESEHPHDRHDLIIRGGTVVDGTGADAAHGRRRDRRRRHHRGRRAVDGRATRVIDADGLLVTPGLRRHPLPLRRPGDVGRAHDPVVVARRHHRRGRQLRRRLRAGARPTTTNASSS